jgi:hypothetical protein
MDVAQVGQEALPQLVRLLLLGYRLVIPVQHDLQGAAQDEACPQRERRFTELGRKMRFGFFDKVGQQNRSAYQ